MANKYETLDLINKGLSNKVIAEELNCLEAYVRAVRAREFGNGAKTDLKYREKVNKASKTIKEREPCRADGRAAYHAARDSGKTAREAGSRYGRAYDTKLKSLVVETKRGERGA